jgi:5'-nucleotidase
MNLLLTNDDGLSSPGLWALYHHLKKIHKVTVIAPDQDRSGCAHSFSLKSPIRLKPVRDNIYACYGTTADCVFAGISTIMTEKPDLVISGINPGPNLGTDILYSGTAAGAREASLRGVPGWALSIGNKKPPFHHDRITAFLDHHWETLLSLCLPGTFINVNFPDGNRGNPRGELIPTIPGNRTYHDTVKVQQSAGGDFFLFIHGETITSEETPGTDTSRVLNGDYSISLIRSLPSGEPWP